MLRSAQVGAGVAAGGLVSAPAPAFGLPRRRAPRPRASRPAATAAEGRRLLAVRRLAGPVLRRAVAARPQPLRLGQQLRRAHLPQLPAAHDPFAWPRWPATTGRAATTTAARALARRLCDSPPWSERDASPEGDPQFHNPGWVESLGTRDAAMDKSIDPKVAEALMYAWRARGVLKLPDETVALIADRISRCARGAFFRFPNVRLNQINWNCELYAHLATVTGDNELLANDYRAQVVALLRRHPARADARRLAQPRPGLPVPLPAPPAADPSLQPRQRRVRERDLPLHPVPRAGGASGHAAAPSGALPPAAGVGRAHRVRLLDPRRLPQLGHRLRLQALACRPHLGARATGPARDRRLAAVPQRARRSPAWAKYMFDRGLGLYERLSREAADAKGIAPSNLYDVNVSPLGPSIREMFAARMQANAARAVALGLGSMGAAEPPPLYSFDGDIGRLTVTTPRYSTAVLPVNQNAFPYGGMELCRLYDGDQRVVSNVGGRPWASFGVLVRDRAREGDRHVAAPPVAGTAAPAAHAARLPAGPGDGGRAVSRPAPTRDRSRRWSRTDARSRARSWWTPRTRFTAEPRRDTVGHRPPRTRAATRSTCCSRPGARARASRR